MAVGSGKPWRGKGNWMSERPSICLIGFSEAGQAFGAGLAAAGASVTAADLRAGEPDLQAAASGSGVTLVDQARDAAADAEIIFSLVTAGAATAVAKAAAGWLQPGQIFLDLNSTGPADKQAVAAHIEAAGATFVEGAIMSPVAGHGHAVPILLAGPRAASLATRLAPLGMHIGVAGETFGAASAAKMCRSIVMKGIEAIVVESMLAARQWGVDGQVLDSLAETYPGIDWPARAGYLFGRTMAHGKRRAAEMEQAAETVAAAGYDPGLTRAIARLQAWIGETASAVHPAGETDYRVLADRLAAAAGNPVS